LSIEPTPTRLRHVADLRDIEVRNAALEHVRELQRRYDDLVPVRALGEGFRFRGRHVSFGSFYSGIFRPKELAGPAALCLVKAPATSGRPGAIRRCIRRSHGPHHLSLRTAKTQTPAGRLQAAADNRALVAAQERCVPVIYLRAIAPRQARTGWRRLSRPAEKRPVAPVESSPRSCAG
jgi:hypothetical protein